MTEETPTICARDYKDPLRVAVPICVGNTNPSGNGQNGNCYYAEGVMPSVCCNKNDGQRVAIPVLTPDRAEKRQNGRRFKEDGEEMFTLTSQDRHGVAIKVKEATKQGYAEAHPGDSINLALPDSKTRRGRVGGQMAQTLDTSCNQGVMEVIEGDGPKDNHPGQFVKLSDDCIVYAVWYEKYNCYIAIRKLTPRECFRLQGWSDEYFDKAQFVNSDSQLYKQAGNGVTVNVAEDVGNRIKNV